MPPALLVGALLGLLAGIKVSNALFVLPALAWLGWNALQHRNWRWIAKVVVVALLLCSSSYFYATVVTGNPLFPLFNGFFKSPLFPAIDLVDKRWMKEGLSWSSLWDLTFETHRFGEYYPGAFGLALLALLPAIVFEAIHSARSRVIALWFGVSGLLMFAQIQYMRYLFPAVGPLVVVGVLGLVRLVPKNLSIALLVVLIAGNLLLLPTTSWILKDDPWQMMIDRGPAGGKLVEMQKIPERTLLIRLLAESPQACLLLLNADAPFGAVAGGRALVVKPRYDLRMAKTNSWANADSTGERWREVLRATGASHVMTSNKLQSSLEYGLELHGFEVIDTLGNVEVWASGRAGERRCTGSVGSSRDEALRHFRPGRRH